MRFCAFFLLSAAIAPLAFAENYILLLSEPPALKGGLTRTMAAHDTIKRELVRRNIQVSGSVQRVLNAVFVSTEPDRVDELRGLPGVQDVVKMRRYTRRLDRAVQLVNVQPAWNSLGGTGNAGAGVKIAVIDTGIEQTHAAFQDPSLQPPAGYPICAGQDCNFTNNKVIVARSYVRQVAAGSLPNPAVDSRPDDYSPRDHVGHGTALAMIAAGVTNTGPAATITGMAPKAFLGNYKIFGSPGVNDGSTNGAIMSALEDALNDGMNVAILSLGSPAFSGPLDTGSACGANAGTPCDPMAIAVENAVSQGLAVVAAGGNEGDLGNSLPTRGTVDSPGYAPSAIAVGATTNSHMFLNSVRVTGNGVPANLQQIPAVFGDGPLPPAPVTAPMRDVTSTGNDGTACVGMPPGSLAGTFALMQRGGCTFIQKVLNAQTAGAVGAIIIQQANDSSLFAPGGLQNVNIPSVGIGNDTGQALRTFLAGNPDYPGTLDPGLAPVDVSTYNQLATFSSQGPSAGNSALKPDMVAPGTNIYMATQTYDPEGEMYDAGGYTVQQGTSFSTPMVAGGVALVKQKNPSFTAKQLKSAVVNTATQDVTYAGSTPGATAIGAGKLDAGAAVQTTITAQPAGISFGAISGTLPSAQQLTLTNAGTAPATLTLSVQPRASSTLAQVTLDRTSFTLQPGQSGNVNVGLSGSRPQPGSYDGAILVQGGAVAIRVPYLFIVSDGVPFDVFPLGGYGVDGSVNEDNPDGGIFFRVVDRYGVGVGSVPVRFAVTQGGGRVYMADSATDRYGVAGAGATFGPSPGAQQFVGSAGSGLSITFDGVARLKPTASSVVNAASFTADTGIAPGSYISIFGTGLSDMTAVEKTSYLPVDLASVSVSFDVPSANISVPGRLYYVSSRQVNVQVPWELAGQTSAQMKVNVSRSNGRLTTASIATYSPAVFEYTASSGARLAAALDAANNLIGPSNPARRGQTVQIFSNGLGPVDNTPASGEPASTQTLSRTTAAPTVTIGGRPAGVSFSGLAPGFAGLYQLNVEVPADAPTGIQALTLSIGGVTAKTSSIPVQ
jgi:uncharacterized protein (TIGR03437 family)